MNQPIKTQIHIATDFSKHPCGRYASDGPTSAQDLRDRIIAPVLKSNPTGDVEIHLDGVMGYGSSFLEEAFGGLIRESGFTGDDLVNRLEFVSKDHPKDVAQIWMFIHEASERAKVKSAPKIDGSLNWVPDGIQGEMAQVGDWMLCVHPSGAWGCFHKEEFVAGDYEAVGTLESAKEMAKAALKTEQSKTVTQ